MMGNGSPWDTLVDEPTNRAPRSLDTRATSERKRTWIRPTGLPEIEPRDGWTHKWVRTDMRNEPDKKNYASKLYEGWEPVDLADYPELQAFSGSKTSGHVEIGGLIACRMPTEMVEQRNATYVGTARQQEADAEGHYMRDPGQLIKKFAENTRRVMFGQKAR